MGHNEATVYLPDKETADGAVLFSHSAIHTDTGAAVICRPRPPFPETFVWKVLCVYFGETGESFSMGTLTVWALA
jgi:hypothetical protein